MELKLSKPLAFIDLEATGIDLGRDRIVEISIIKVHPDGQSETYTRRVNPQMPIPEEAINIHGITNEDVKDAPTFSEISQEVVDFLEDANIAGYNSNRFDVPMLVEEFLRAGTGFNDNRKYVDVMRIFTLMEKRTLEAAYQFFCDKTLENAHSAEADARATFEILKAQLDRYQESLQNDVNFLHDFTKDADFVDFGRRMVYIDGVEHFNFGKFKGRPVEEVLEKEPQYYDWMMRGTFPEHTKLKLKLIRLRMKEKKKRN